MSGSGEEYRLWRHKDVLDTTGDKIGSVDDVYYDDATGRPQWLLVKTGLLGTKKVLVPAYDVGLQGDELTVPFTEEKVKGAPRFDPDEMLTEEHERTLYSHYDLDYVASVEAVRWDEKAVPSEEEVRHLLGRPSQCIRLNQTVMMEPVPQDDEEG
jgi:sporulation protein YlmC with PRC-barrel domain